MFSVPKELETMATIDPSEPAILHNSLTDEIETRTGEDAAGLPQERGIKTRWHQRPMSDRPPQYVSQAELIIRVAPPCAGRPPIGRAPRVAGAGDDP